MSLFNRKPTASISPNSIAVIGMACEFPGAKNYHQYWQNLIQGIDCICEIPVDRWSWQDYYGNPQLEKNKTNIKWGGFITDIDQFDPLFFNLSPKEASYIDPQHRIFLQTAWHAIEDAGYSTRYLSGKKVGVYVGVSKNDYSELMREKQEEITSFVSTGTVHSLLANRVSFLLNLRGPSEVIDTACSSSLVALNHAIQSLNSGECELALVGGVNALLSPTMFISHSKSGMLAEDGRCKTFDAKANGYVRAEGVGALLLKPLAQALADRDYIHGVMIGSAVNHGGKANFLTAPNVNAQAEVVEAAIRKAGITPDTISYIETHGTGTVLGDPIEINGLKKAFACSNETYHQHCGLGSVKTNIGHLESASGIASIIKVLLSMQHKQLPGILHFQDLNPHIELAESPFYIITENKVWHPLLRNNTAVPRRAGVSSFGMGGVNAHLILEEAPIIQSIQEKCGEHLMLLSARMGRLNAYAEQLLNFLSSADQCIDDEETYLARIAYSLQTGRDVYEERIAWIVTSVAEFKHQLKSFVYGTGETNYVYGQVKPLMEKKNIAATQDRLTLAKLWVLGNDIDWSQYYANSKLQRLPLPGYPFAYKSCWVQNLRHSVECKSVELMSVDSSRQLSHLLKTTDFCSDHHIVQHQSILPGAGYLALIRSFVSSHDQGTISFKDVYWLAPTQVTNTPISLRVQLTPVKEGTTFNIQVDEDAKCRGTVVKPQAVSSSIVDLNSIRARCVHQVVKSSLYQMFQSYGLAYGASLQMLEQFCWQGHEAFAEAKFTLADNQSTLYTAFIDAAFQTVVGLSLHALPSNLGQLVPYHAKAINILSPLSSRVYIHAVLVDPTDKNKNDIYQFNIFIYDEAGVLLATIDHFTKRVLKSLVQPLYYHSVWEPKPIAKMSEAIIDGLLIFEHQQEISKRLKQYDEKLKIISVGMGEAFKLIQQDANAIRFNINVQNPSDYEKLLNFLKKQRIQFTHIIHAWNFSEKLVDLASGKKTNTFLQQGVHALLYLTQAFIATKIYSTINLLYCFAIDPSLTHPCASTAGGFIRTLRYENPQFRYASIGIDHESQQGIARTLVQELLAVDASPLCETRYLNQQRFVRVIRPLEDIIKIDQQPSLLRHKGTYLITGGAGGLAAMFARYLAKNFQATILLVGRNPCNTKTVALIDEIYTLGGHAEYVLADVADEKNIKKAFKKIQKKFKVIHGIIHAAGFLDDGFIFRKTSASFAKVLAPKIHGALHVDTFSRKWPLDFFLVFSSIAALMPNQGQCDYAAGNSFLDEFSRYRKQLAERAQRSGVSISINWPLWREGGMSVTDEEEAHLLKVFGMKALERDNGMRIFEFGLKSAQDKVGGNSLTQLIAIIGDEKKINQQFGVAGITAAEPSAVSSSDAEKKIHAILAQAFARLEKNVQPKQSLRDLSIDSLQAAELVTAINKQLQLNLKPTLFFEIETVEDLTRLLLDQYQLKISKKPDAHNTLIDLDYSILASNGRFQKSFDCTEFYLVDHVVNDQYNVPGACYIEMARQAAMHFNPDRPIKKLMNNYWAQQLSSSGEKITAFLQITIQNNQTNYEITSIDAQNNRIVHAAGEVIYGENYLSPGSLDISAIKQRCVSSQTSDQIYPQIIAEGLHVGPTFMPMQTISLNAQEALATLHLPDSIANSKNDYGLHPTLLTGLFQTALISHRFTHVDDPLHYIPIAIDEIEWYDFFPSRCYVYCQPAATNRSSKSLRKFNLFACNEQGDVFLVLKGFTIKGLLKENLQMNSRQLQVNHIASVNSDSASLTSMAQDYLKQLLVKTLQLVPNEIDAQLPFETYGIDSVVILQLNTLLAEDFPSLSKTLFFEYSNLEELAEYFSLHHRERLSQLFMQASGTEFDQTDLASDPVIFLANQKTEEDICMSSNDIAIIGMSGRYPQAKNLQKFWENLKAGKDCITSFPVERLQDYQDVHMTSFRGGFIDDVDKFDPLFFNISPREAAMTDPQERLFLTVAWETLEDAGYTKALINERSRKTGVFVGALWQPYINLGIEESLKGHAMGPSGLLYSIANRVSYFFDFQGPSLVVDTACSSSLTALHLACESLHRGESHCALVGGVNLSLHSSKYLFLKQHEFLSTDARCRSFGAGGDGYVPGEGVCAVLLKPLAMAIQDNDQIYGVIKSTVINHGGKTNGYTVPNPNAQRELIVDAIEQAKIDPRTIGYVEAHGTGTGLGDPIEITGLAQAYAKYTKDKSFCSIGSVKSNVGHLEAAAGLCGLTKLLLQMKYEKLVPSLHAEELNQNICFEDTAFYVQRELSDWPRVIREEKILPRRAALSSFGAGGSNAHVILEEWLQQAKSKVVAKPYYLVTLSAKQLDILKQRIEDLSDNLHANIHLSLESIAYTLNVGRAHFNYRCAFLVSSIDDLLVKFDQVKNSPREKSENYFYGEAIKTPEDDVIYKKSLKTSLEELQKINLCDQEKYLEILETLANLYVKGYQLDWKILHHGESQQRQSLPTYPFLQERYWLPRGDFKKISPVHSTLHPLLDTNISTLGMQSFKKVFTGQEFYLIDHQVCGHKILPGVVYLEMARAAAELAMPGKSIKSLRSIVWSQPITVSTSPCEVKVNLISQENSLMYEISSELNGQYTLHGQGLISDTDHLDKPKAWVLPDQMKERLKEEYLKERIYQEFQAIGIQYGTSFQTLEWLRTNGKELVGHYCLPEIVQDESNAYMIPPSLLDGVLQTIIAFMLTNQQSHLQLPFALNAMQIYEAIPRQGYILAKGLSRNKADAESASYDFQLLDETGKVCVSLDGLMTRKITAEILTSKDEPLHYYSTHWIEKSLPLTTEAEQIKSLCVFTEEESWLEILKQQFSGVPLIQISTGEKYKENNQFSYIIRNGEEEDYNRCIKAIQQSSIAFSHFVQISRNKKIKNITQAQVVEGVIETELKTTFMFIQQLIKTKALEKIRWLSLYEPSMEALMPMMMLRGMAKSLLREHPDCQLTLLGLASAQQDWQTADLVAQLKAEILAPVGWGMHVRYQAGKRKVECYENFDINDDQKSLEMKSWRKHGVYLITGGLGGLGFLLAQHLANTYQAKLVLTGRSALDKEKIAQLKLLESFNAEVLYLQGDIAVDGVAKTWLTEAKLKFGKLNGVIHCAGVLHDGLFMSKRWKEFQSVLWPKVQGTIYLDEATQLESLDFFLLFSSLVSCLGNVGQSDYAAANSFLDEFARWRAEEVYQGRRQGKTVSVNWPLWIDGGMQIDEMMQCDMQSTLSIHGLPTVSGLIALTKSLQQKSSQCLVIYGDHKTREKIFSQAILGNLTSQDSLIKNSLSKNLSDETEKKDLRTAWLTDFKKIISEILDVPVNVLDVEEDLNSYGFDSVSFTALANRIKQTYQIAAIVPTLFFEYSTINSFTDYCWRQYEATLLHYYQSAVAPVLPQRQIEQVDLNFSEHSATLFETIDIAIIGMAGIFPGAPDVETFWQNLLAEKDLIRAIPRERWDTSVSAKEASPPPWGGFIDDIDQFDAGFFNISPREAELMDPQHRLFLQTVWKTIEDAGYAPEHLAKQKTALFVGVSTDDYAELLQRADIKEAYVATGNARSVLANRISYLLDLTGPSEAIDAACSSSLVALHRAVRAIQTGECQLAIAGGVNALLTPSLYWMFSQAGMLSPEGRCKTFDQSANGYVRGEGVGAILLKPLSQALQDGDMIYGVIKGSHVNHGGHVNSLTAPNPNAQSALISELYQRFHIAPETVSYIETHGTGTSLGDPIEINGLKKAFQLLAEQQETILQKQRCGLGSVKANIGHLEAAAGIAGIVKVLMMLKHKQLPKQIHLHTLNPYIELSDSPFYVVSKTQAWNAVAPRRAAISSFGFGGTNAHVVIEEAQQQAVVMHQSKPYYLVSLSAKQKEALREKIIQLSNHLNSHLDLSIESLAYTLNLGRSHFQYRCAFVVSSVEALQEKLIQLQKNPEQLLQHYFYGEVGDERNGQIIQKEILQDNLEKLHMISIRDDQVYKERLEVLADLYVKGYQLDWTLLHQNETHQKLRLPTYPFLKKRYWYSDHTKEEKVPLKLLDAQYMKAQYEDIPKLVLTEVNSALPEEKELLLQSEITFLDQQMMIDHYPPITLAQNTAEDAMELKQIKRVLKEILSQLIYSEEEIDEEKVFNAYGIDSILGIEFIKNINLCFSLKLSTSTLYDHPTIKQLSACVLETLPKQKKVEVENVINVSHSIAQENQEAVTCLVSNPRTDHDAIAIVGMAAYLPQASELDTLWEHLATGHSAITEIPPQRWSIDQHYSANLDDENKSYSKWGGFIQHVDQFDPLFFDISPAEAEWMDPQQRLFLEVGWQALEDAGYTQTLNGSRCGVYVGVMNSDYQELAHQLDIMPTSHCMLGNSRSILAARIAYFLNLKGPVITVDTACSSSLVATHMACQTLQRKEADLMLVGGVTLYLTETPYIEMSKAGMLSKDGACKTFDNSADGFVPGEGCTAIVLKRLEDAIKTGERIYGVIRGSGINQDGKTNGITAPSAESQKSLALSVYKDYQINPAEITYVEAHGTGTKLGDPIEVQALTETFKTFTENKQYCALGSIKSNVGHTSAAAGVAGIIKVLLCMQHKKLVPSLHFNQANEHIDFTGSPFYVNTELKDWHPIDNKPLLAAVSAFGFSGTNAHVVIEAGPEFLAPTPKAMPAYFIGISAKHDDALMQKIQDLRNFLCKTQDVTLGAVAYTLNSGRSHFECRCALVVSSMEELRVVLEDILHRKATGAYFISERKSKKDFELIAEEILEKILHEIKEGRMLDPAIYRRKFLVLAELYSKGYEINWQILHQGEIKQYIQLPKYPFLREHYWLPKNILVKSNEAFKVHDQLHPLIYKNISTLDKQVFQSLLKREDFFLRDHQVEEQYVLPGVAYLEMARAAIALALPGHKVKSFSEIVWVNPIVISAIIQLVETRLHRQGADIEFEVVTYKDSDCIIHAKGIAQYAPIGDIESNCLNIEALKTHCGAEKLKEEIYRNFNVAGVHYGEGFKSVEKLWHNETEVLAELCLPSHLVRTSSEWVLHPSLLDGALQSSIGLFWQDYQHRVYMPFSIERVEIFHPVSSNEKFYAYLQKVDAHRFHLVLLNNVGVICVKLSNASVRPLKRMTPSLSYYQPGWKECPIEALSNNQINSIRNILIVAPEQCAPLQQALIQRHADDQVIKVVPQFSAEFWGEFMSRIDQIDVIYFLHYDLNDVEKLSEKNLLVLFHFLKTLIQKNLLSPSLAMRLITFEAYAIQANDSVSPCAAGAIGLVRAFSHEYPHLSVGCIDLPLSALDVTRAPIFVAAILAELTQKTKSGIALRGNVTRFVQEVSPLSLPAEQVLPAFRKKGTYLIVGGTGGIGFILSQHLAKNYQANLIWIGRSAEEFHRDKIAMIQSLGSVVLYCQVDVADAEAMSAAIDTAKLTFDVIHGAIHSALVLKDKTLANMTESVFKEVLAPKLSGSIALHRALRNEPLDFLLFFSSLQSFLSKPGQANYAASCMFQDAFAHLLQKTSVHPVKIINWSYWGSVGVVATPEYRKSMELAGILSIEAEEGVKVIEEILTYPMHQCIVVKAKEFALKNLSISHQSQAVLAAEHFSSCMQKVVEKSQIRGINVPYAQPIAFAAVKRWGNALLLYVFQQMGISEVSNKQKNNIIPAYDRLFNALLNIADLPQEDSLVTLNLLQQQKQALIQQYPEFKAHVELLWTCVMAYPEVLTGQRSYMEVMFPQGSLALVEGIYQHNPIADYFNLQMTNCIKAFIQERIERDPYANISILEIGAGTGGTSRLILETLAKMKVPVRYFYTDVSMAFVNFGQDKLEEEYPWVVFQRLDIEALPILQGIEQQSIDLVFASNVLHATKQIDATLNHVKYFLKANGLLVLNELVKHDHFATMTFGLTEGWWRFEDADRRIPYSPALSISQWKDALMQAGYRSIHILNSADESMSHRIILAESDGCVTVEDSQGKPAEKTVVSPSNIFFSQQQTVQTKVSASLEESARDFVKSVFSQILKINPSVLDDHVNFERYGVDSLLVLEFNKRFSEVFGKLPSTLLFEHSSIYQLVNYFVRQHEQTLKEKFQTVSIPSPKIFEKSTIATTNDVVEQKLSIIEKNNEDDIAIIGLSGRYPGGNTLEEFWELLKNGHNAITEVPLERWDWRQHFNSTPSSGNCYSKWGGFISDVDQFDAWFFHITPTDADNMDPQERLFLETAWCTFEDAGYAVNQLGGSTSQVGVFVGVMNSDYDILSGELYRKEVITKAHAAYWSIANRTSYLFNFQGPSMAVDTACSSSLTALHLACESLKRGECELALAGGVNLILHPMHYLRLCSVNMLSKSDQCKPFAESADGFVDAEGVGAVLLKPLSKAIRDNDNIYAIIKASAINAGGKTSGFTVPNLNAQAAVVSKAINQSGIDPRTISYLEAHGTGTSLGDPIEVAALTKAYQKFTHDKQFCAIGSVKSNIGHLESAAGMAGLTKIILQLKHKKIVPSLHSENLNSKIDFIDSPFMVQSKLAEWSQPIIQGKPCPRRAGISSFGAGGANAHVIIEEYCEASVAKIENQETTAHHLIIFSATNEMSLRAYANKMIAFLEANRSYAESSLADICYTLQIGRKPMQKRLALIVQNVDELLEKLRDFIHKGTNVEQLYFGDNKRNQDSISMLGGAIKEKSLSELALLWSCGAEVDWRLLYSKPLKRISLPTYSFQHSRHWVQCEDDSLTDEAGDIRKNLVKIIADILSMDIKDVDTQATYHQLGLDHVELLKMIKAINAYDIAKADPLKILACNNIDHLVSYLMNLKLNTSASSNEDMKIENQIVTIIAKILKTSESEIDVNADISEYGLDSINVMFLNAKLAEAYGDVINPSMVVRHRTIKKLAATIMRSNGVANINY